VGPALAKAPAVWPVNPVHFVAPVECGTPCRAAILKILQCLIGYCDALRWVFRPARTAAVDRPMARRPGI